MLPHINSKGRWIFWRAVVKSRVCKPSENGKIFQCGCRCLSAETIKVVDVFCPSRRVVASDQVKECRQAHQLDWLVWTCRSGCRSTPLEDKESTFWISTSLEAKLAFSLSTLITTTRKLRGGVKERKNCQVGLALDYQKEEKRKGKKPIRGNRQHPVPRTKQITYSDAETAVDSPGGSHVYVLGPTDAGAASAGFH